MNKDQTAFVYQYEACVKRIFKVCVNKEIVSDTYSMDDKIIMKKLHDMGFVLKVRSLP